MNTANSDENISAQQTGYTEIYPEPCPDPVGILVPGCQDAVHAAGPEVTMTSLGRIIQVDLTIKAVCPGKRVAVSVILNELDSTGAAQPRGVKHILIPAQTGERCRDIALRCIAFSVPEALDATGSQDSICNARHFEVQAIANYVDTDFSCCKIETQIS